MTYETKMDIDDVIEMGATKAIQAMRQKLLKQLAKDGHNPELFQITLYDEKYQARMTIEPREALT